MIKYYQYTNTVFKDNASITRVSRWTDGENGAGRE